MTVIVLVIALIKFTPVLYCGCSMVCLEEMLPCRHIFFKHYPFNQMHNMNVCNIIFQKQKVA